LQKNRSIYTSDILIILKIYAPDSYHISIWDPKNKITNDSSLCFSTPETDDFKVLIYVPSVKEYYCRKSLLEYDLVLDFSKTLKNIFSLKHKLNYINNPSGKMRWLYLDENRKATFLKFYNIGSLKASLNAFLIKSIFELNLQILIRSGSFKIHYKDELKIKNVIDSFPRLNYSLFLGTEGSNRTALLELSDKNEDAFFYKIPISHKSKLSVANEKRFLKNIQNNSFKSFKVPKFINSNHKDVLITKGFKHNGVKRSSKFTESHYTVIQEITLNTKQFSGLKDSPYWLEIENILLKLKKQNTFSREVNLIEQLKLDLSNNELIHTCLSHGDFTPWNMYVTPKNLQIYDWEMAEDQMPILFDLFHFYFQTGVFVNHSSYSKIKTSILKTCEHSKIRNLVDLFKIKLDFYLKLYILKQSAKYFFEFQNERYLTKQQKWHMNILSDAIKDSCLFTDIIEHRSSFIDDLNDEMQSLSHTYLKLLNPEITKLSKNSDLDILIDPKALNHLTKFCKNHSYVDKVNIYTKSFMSSVDIYLKDQGFLAIDFIHSFKRKHIHFLNPSILLSSASNNAKGYKIPNPKLDFEYTYLFYQLNGSSVPTKYQKHFLELSIEKGNKILKYIQRKYDLDQYSKEELMVFNPEIRSKILRKINKLSFNSGAQFIQNCFLYVSDAFYDLINRQGMVITLSGVDGAGKTTIIEKIKRELENKYRKEVVLQRHRPGILPILSAIKHGEIKAEEIAAVTIPRQGKNNNIVSSLARFTYYFSDYLIGQFYVFFKYTLRGKLVLYDRYYFDFINDSKRSNIQLNPLFIKSLYRFIFKPQLNFFLYADASIILGRKKEMDEKQIVRITKLYKDLFTQLNNQNYNEVYKSIENIKIEDTVSQIFKSYHQSA